MSNISIDASTTSTELYREVFTEYYYTYEEEFAQLIESYPEYEELIRQAWLEAEVYNIAYEGFKDFFFSIIIEPTSIFDDEFDF